MNLLKYRVAQVVSTANLISKYNKQNLRRVLMYHSVVKNTESAFQKSDIYSISETYFTRHVEYLAHQSNSTERKVVSLEDSLLSGVSITFDDGYKDTLTIAAPLLCKDNLPFHVFVTPANVISGDNRYLSETELVSLSKLPGVTIGAHGFSHQHLNTLQAAEITDELKSSKEWLENLTQRNITTMSYPHGAFNSQVQEIAASVGYLYAATSSWGCYQVGFKPLEIPRIDVWNLDNQTTLKQKLNGQWDWIGKLLSPLQATIR
jgi:hypothetical protein